MRDARVMTLSALCLMRVPLLFVTAIWLGMAAAAAQATRAEEDRAKRESKATQLTPERRSWLEAVLYKIDEDLIIQRIFNRRAGSTPGWGGIGEGAGFGEVRDTSTSACPSIFARRWRGP